MAEDQKDLYYLSWADFYEATKNLAQHIKESSKTYKGLLGITRGGLIPMGILAQELGIKTIETVGIQSYSAQERGVIRLIRPYKDVAADGAGWIVVDELSDTGATFAFLRDRLPQALYVAPYVKPLGIAYTDLFVREVPQSQWIVFPWEVLED